VEVTFAAVKNLADGGVDLVQILGRHETLEHRDVRPVRLVQCEAYGIASMTPPPPYYIAGDRIGDVDLTIAETELIRLGSN